MERLPAGSWDSHVHVFGSRSDYPVRARNPLYAPPEECDPAALARLHDDLGVEHAVLVQPTAYASDHRLMLETIAGAPAGKYIGVAIIDENVDDAELRRLHRAGVRGARFNFGGKFRLSPSHANLQRDLKRAADLGWFVKVFGYGEDFLSFEKELLAIECPAVIDHIGGFDVGKGTDAPGFQLLVELLKRKNWWGLLSNGDNRVTQGPPWREATPFGRSFFETAPERCLWGSDWPHLHRLTRPTEHASHDIGAAHQLQRLALVKTYLPDEDAFRKVMVENPARLARALG